MVKIERKEVGVPLSVVEKPDSEEVVGVWAAVNARIEEMSAEAWKRLERAMMIVNAQCQAWKQR